MNPTRMQRMALVARDAHSALLDLKRIVDSAVEKTRAAELQSVGAALGAARTDDPLSILRTAAEALRSSDFETAVSQARTKTECALSCYFTANKE
jgi:hypothetical protein